MNNELIEALSARQHAIWAHWMLCQFEQCTLDEDGNLVISKELVERWARQMLTHYDDLTDKEKESNRNIVRQFLVSTIVETIIGKIIVKIRPCSQSYLPPPPVPDGEGLWNDLRRASARERLLQTADN